MEAGARSPPLTLEGMEALPERLLSTMKVGGRKSYSAGPLGSVVLPAGAGQVEGPEPANVPTGDRIEISTGRGAADIKKALASIPDVRMERITDIRESVEDGSYHVDSEKIAKRVVHEALEDALRRDRR